MTNEGEDVCLDIQVKFYPSDKINLPNTCVCGSTTFTFVDDGSDDDEATEFDTFMACKLCYQKHKVAVKIISLKPKDHA